VDESRLWRLLAALSEEGATDLHLKAGSPPKVRIKGVLEPVSGENRLTRPEVDDAALEMLGSAAAVVLDGQLAVTYAVDGVGRFRVSAYSQRGSTALIVRRTLDRVGTLDELGLPTQTRQLAEARHGLVIVAGQPHSGRRRTLASLLDHVNRVRAAHIVAIEQPLELLHRDVMASVSQLEVGGDVASFGDGVRAARLADADVVVVSDVTDEDVAAELVRAAEDGLLVLVGMKAAGGVDAVRRFVNLFKPEARDAVRLSLAGVLIGTVAQRLAPRARSEGRVPVVEIVMNSADVQACLFDAETLTVIEDIVERSAEQGMQSFATAAADLMAAGTVDLRGVLSVVDDWQRAHRALTERGVI
jgi:twitching motility protein PilT